MYGIVQFTYIIFRVQGLYNTYKTIMINNTPSRRILYYSNGRIVHSKSVRCALRLRAAAPETQKRQQGKDPHFKRNCGGLIMGGVVKLRIYVPENAAFCGMTGGTVFAFSCSMTISRSS